MLFEYFHENAEFNIYDSKLKYSLSLSYIHAFY